MSNHLFAKIANKQEVTIGEVMAQRRPEEKFRQIGRVREALARMTLSWGLPGTPVVPFCPFYLEFPKLNSRKKGTLIINGLLGNLV